jgi:hypothetical protein
MKLTKKQGELARLAACRVDITGVVATTMLGDT